MQPPEELRDIAQYIPDLILDIRYATPDNFTGTQLYGHQLAWLRPEPLAALVEAADELRTAGYKLVVFDAYRPPSVQRKLRVFCSDDDYVMEVSNHCRGITVDVTLAYESGSYLDMGTDYDDFAEKSHPGSKNVTKEQQENRLFLAKALEKRGFFQHPHEWWHFDFRPDMDWPLLDDELNTYNGS